MDQKAKIPLINANNASDFHFGHILWKLPISASRNLFHINKLEDYLGKIKFPLPPHRKPVIDLIFLSKGRSIRYKGLQKYEKEKRKMEGPIKGHSDKQQGNWFDKILNKSKEWLNDENTDQKL